MGIADGQYVNLCITGRSLKLLSGCALKYQTRPTIKTKLSVGGNILQYCNCIFAKIHLAFVGCKVSCYQKIGFYCGYSRAAGTIEVIQVKNSGTGYRTRQR